MLSHFLNLNTTRTHAACDSNKRNFTLSRPPHSLCLIAVIILPSMKTPTGHNSSKLRTTPPPAFRCCNYQNAPSYQIWTRLRCYFYCKFKRDINNKNFKFWFGTAEYKTRSNWNIKKFVIDFHCSTVSNAIYHVCDNVSTIFRWVNLTFKHV